MSVRKATTRTAQLELMAAFKNYVDLVVAESLARRGVDAVVPIGPQAPADISRTRWIYFIQGVDGGPIKIGIANDPEKRLATLQRTSPVQLQIICRYRGGIADEKTLHETFAEWRLHGEWFEPSDAVLDIVETVQAGLHTGVAA